MMDRKGAWFILNHKTRFLIFFTFILWMLTPNAWAERLSVFVSDANIRSGPGTQYDVLWRVEKYYPMEIIKKSGAWYYFRDFEGDTGWIHQSLVENTPSVIVDNTIANIRSGPGTSYQILFSVENGVPFKVLKRQGDWLHVEHGDGDRGWIHRSLVW